MYIIDLILRTVRIDFPFHCEYPVSKLVHSFQGIALSVPVLKSTIRGYDG